MKKLTDQELDSLFKAASEGYQPAFDAASWEAMADKLNQPKPSVWKKWMPYTLVGLIIFSSGVWIGTFLNNDQTENKAEVSDQEKDLVRENQKEQPIIDQLLKEDETEILRRENNKDNGIVNRNIISPGDKKAIRPVIINTANENKENLDSLEKDNLAEQLRVDEFEILTKESPKDSTLLTNEETKTDTTKLIAKEKEKRKDHRSSHSISLRALASPDFSAINFSSASSVGSNYAFLLEYQINPRLTISTGAIRSMKKYSYDNEITYSGRTADQLDGTCRIIDIPLNIYYSFPTQSKISFYTGIGLSSYIMQQENYTYTVNYTYSSRSYSTQVEDKNNEWFKVLNFSAGVQYQLTHRMHLQVEPFLKASLAGVGEGDVLLNSAGVFFGLKYKIN
jgi:opacity protein-like surface antigen